MQISLILAQQIAELFLILLIGCVLVKARLLKSADSRVLSVVMVYAVMPCVIINAFQVDYSPAVVTGLLYAFALAIALHALLLLLARLLRRPLRLDVIERTCIIYTNAGSGSRRMNSAPPIKMAMILTLPMIFFHAKPRVPQSRLRQCVHRRTCCTTRNAQE